LSKTRKIKAVSEAKNCGECNLKEQAGEYVYYCPKLRVIFYNSLLDQKLCEGT
jgi:hypothetical protein